MHCFGSPLSEQQTTLTRANCKNTMCAVCATVVDNCCGATHARIAITCIVCLRHSITLQKGIGSARIVYVFLVNCLSHGYPFPFCCVVANICVWVHVLLCSDEKVCAFVAWLMLFRIDSMSDFVFDYSVFWLQCQPYEVVWAKVKGFPLWPAKVVCF
jgi:hypothetical protein